VSGRAAIRMTDAEVAAFLDEQRTVTCATIGRDGRPHLMPLWYVVRGGELWAWTYARSQKVRNLERDPRCTLQVEAGEAYGELRGVMLQAECEIVRDLEAVVALAAQLAARYELGSETPDVEAAWRVQAPKRVALRFRPHATASWDHRKL
jgi:PPOX class probable F420-dependent enzyme